MGKIGTQELLIILAIVLLIFGPKALPKLGRSAGKTLGSFKKGLNEFEEDEDDDDAEKTSVKKTVKKEETAEKAVKETEEVTKE